VIIHVAIEDEFGPDEDPADTTTAAANADRAAELAAEAREYEWRSRCDDSD
jgi:hypothetical protein